MQDFTILLFSCVLTSCCRLSFNIKFYKVGGFFTTFWLDLVEFQLFRKRYGTGFILQLHRTMQFFCNFFFALRNYFFVVFAFCLPLFHASFITSSLGEDSWSLGQYGGVFLSCTDKLNRRTLLVRPISKQDPFSNFSGFFPSVRIFLKIFYHRTSTNRCWLEEKKNLM